MIGLILIYPLIACLILFLTKKVICHPELVSGSNKEKMLKQVQHDGAKCRNFLNNFFIISYALIHFTVSLSLISGKTASFTPFFEVNASNKLFLIVLSIVYLAFAFYNRGYMKDDKSEERRLRHYAYMVLCFVFAMTGAVLSSNLGLMWVFIEGTTLASAYLIYFHKTKHSIEAAWKYVFICSIGIALAFAGIIFLTASEGGLNSLFFKDLYAHAAEFNKFWLQAAFVFILFGIGAKMGLAPVHFWLPDAHAQSPSPVSALLSAALLNCAFLMIMKVFKITVIAGYGGYAQIMLFVMGFLSLFIAAVFIYHINNYKRMLAYSSVENMGILAIGLALGGAGALAAMLHLAGHSLIKASFFMTSGNILKIYGTKKIKNITGLTAADKKTGFLWVFSFLGIAAFPPSILFISEFLLVKTLIKEGHYLLTALFLLLLTIILYGMGRAVINMTFGSKDERHAEFIPASGKQQILKQVQDDDIKQVRDNAFSRRPEFISGSDKDRCCTLSPADYAALLHPLPRPLQGGGEQLKTIYSQVQHDSIEQVQADYVCGSTHTLPLSMYLPQAVLLAAAFTLGIIMPDFVSELFASAAGN